MVSFNVYRATSSGAYVEGICLDSDEKPVVGIANGSILFSVNAATGETTRYMYDQGTMSWIEAACPCSGSGGSGSGGSGSGGGVFVVHDVDGTLDKTYAEIVAAAQTGVVVLPRAGALSSSVSYLVSYGPGLPDGYALNFGNNDEDQYSALSESEYPTLDSGEPSE